MVLFPEAGRGREEAMEGGRMVEPIGGSVEVRGRETGVWDAL